MPYLDAEGARLYHEVRGEGTPGGVPVVLVHGSWSDHHNWDQVVPALGAGVRAVVYDRRGHGASREGAELAGIDAHVADLATVVEQAAGGPALVAGGSTGACIALRLAATRPELVRAAVLHEPLLPGLLPAGDQEADEERERIDRVLAHLEAGTTEDGAALFVETVMRVPGGWGVLPPPARQRFLDNAAAFLADARDPHLQDLHGVDPSRAAMPVVLTTGSTSPAYFHAIVDALVARLPDARQVMLDGAAHVPHVTHPGLVAAAIRDTLLRVGPPT